MPDFYDDVAAQRDAWEEDFQPIFIDYDSASLQGDE
jgi:hypothetical protein